MEAYEGGGHAYHATMPTDALKGLRDMMLEMKEMGFDQLKAAQWEQGEKVRALLAAKGVRSVAAEGFQAPGVVVSYTDNPEVQSGRAFAGRGVQIAAGVPLQVGEGADFRTFRIGLFGLDKLRDVDASVARLAPVLDQVF
jgi:aspartate aminotransferase-like enzyme